MTKAFEGIRVIDFTQVLSGPYATAHMAMLGADVVKVEAPEGDQWRTMLATDEWLAREMSPGFLAVGSGKRSIALDLKSDAGVEITRRLIAGADVVAQNFRPGVIERLGFGWEAVREIKPDIVYCAISGFGQTGPHATSPAYDGAIQAASGMMSLTGTPESGPIRTGFMTVDTATGLTAALAIATALFRRERTGEGQYLDVAMNDTAISIMSPVIANHLMTGAMPELLGNTSPARQGTSNTWATRDGHMTISVVTDRLAPRLLKGLGREDLIDDPRYATEPSRIEHAASIHRDIAETLLIADTDVWVARLRAEGVPTAPVNDLPHALADPQLDGRGALMRPPPPSGIDADIHIPGTGWIADVGSPSPEGPSPRLGEHGVEILAELGYDSTEIDELRTRGVIRIGGQD